MKIRLRLFASLQKWLPNNPIDHEVSEPKTIREFLREKGIPEEAIAICICNGDKVNADRPLRDGDSLEIFPLIGGG
ncbi:MAG: sulfur carrier protein ThiS [Rectinemataceae bacterium]|nr:sulfur carrier protein ThiS [Rectinemataceae bacterium]